jgi:PAS domain S-box-containing protein
MEKPFYKLLLIEDNPIDARMFRHKLELAGVNLAGFRVADTLSDSFEMIKAECPDVVFLDLSITDSYGINTFRKFKASAGNIPVIILTGNDDEQLALDALREGAQDYLLKCEVSSTLISRSIIYAIERKKIENELLNSKANTEALIENTKDGIWAVDKEFRFTTINSRFSSAFQLLTGKKPVIGKTILEYLNPDHKNWLKDILQNALSGEQFRVETRLKFGTELHDLELSVNPIRIQNNIIDGVSFFARNINQRKKTEERVRKSEHAYRLLLETINEGILFIDNDNKIRFVNRKFSEVTGFNEEEITGKDFRDLLAHDEISSGKNIVGSLLDDQNPMEIHMRTKKGGIVWFRIKGSPLMDNSGQIGGTLLTHTEITEQKQAQEKIRKQEQDYRNLVETMHEGLAFLDKEGNLKFANGRFFELCGYNSLELIQKKLPATLFPNTILQLVDDDAKNKSSHESITHQYEIQVTPKSGSKKWCMLNCSVIYDDDGHYSGLLATYSDITDRKGTEEKLQLARTELNTFIYKSSHDLKGPLASIIGLLNLLEKDKSAEHLDQFTGMMRQSAEKLDKMLNELLNVVRIKRDKIYPELVDFNLVIKSVLKSLSNEEGFKEITKNIHVDVTNSVRTDKRLLHFILANVIDNAIKFRSTEKAPVVNVTIRDLLHGVTIEVIDNGIGFDEKTQENIFTMFTRGSIASKGNGLGLYVVKNAIDRLGGAVQVSSYPGFETKFSIFLPDLYFRDQAPGALEKSY